MHFWKSKIQMELYQLSSVEAQVEEEWAVTTTKYQ